MSTEFENQNPQVEQTEETGLTFVEPKIVPQVATLWNNTRLFNQTYKMANIICQSELVPQNYRGKPADVLIAIDIGNRIGISPIIVMQQSLIVKGNFTWKGGACKSMVDGCGKYKNTHYEMVGERGTDSWGYYLRAEEKNGRIVDGVTVTIAMAKSEGWYNQNPKWRNVPELMLKYRCSSYFMRTECPGVGMGFLTAEEMEDIEYNTTMGGAELSKKLDEEN